MKTRKKVWKRLLILLIVILALFAGINLFWLLTTKLPYDGYINKVELVYDETDEEVFFYQKNIDGYCYTVNPPEYLAYGGFLSVGTEEGYVAEINDEGEVISSNGLDVSLYIWPGLFGNIEYGVFFLDEGKGVFEQVEVDGNLNYIPDKGNEENEEFTQYIESLIQENKDEIKHMMEGAGKLWGLES